MKKNKLTYCLILILNITIFPFYRNSLIQQTSHFQNINNLKYVDKDYPVLKRMLMSKCNVENCSPTQGICKGEKCVCLDGFLTLPMKNDHKSCNYSQKKVIFALLLESFGLIGFGHIYAGRIFNGILKFIFFYSIIFFGTQFVVVIMKEDSDTPHAYYFKMFICGAIISIPVIWHFVDLYKFSTNQYLDGNDIHMINW